MHVIGAKIDLRSARGLPLKNELNDLTNTEWMVSTKSVWFDDDAKARHVSAIAIRFQEWLSQQIDGPQIAEELGQPLPSVMLSTPPQRDELKIQHPATFAETDIAKLIRFFTKHDELVLDPFLGSGSTSIAAIDTGRRSIGVELVDRWYEIAEERVRKHRYSFQLNMLEPADSCTPSDAEVIRGDARQVLSSMPEESVDFVITSPPYWGILSKAADHKSKAERLSKDLPTDYGSEEGDLSCIADYPAFIASIGAVMKECFRLLRPKRYACVIVSDFRHRSRFVTYHSDLSNETERQGFTLEGITILVQNSKNLYPYGIPYAFVSNIHHQYILIFRKPKGS